MKADLDHEERNRAFIARQLRIAQEAAKEREGDTDAHQRPTKLQRTDRDEKITIGFASTKASKDAGTDAMTSKPAFNVFNSRMDAETAALSRADNGASKRKRNAVDTIMAEEERRKRQLVKKQEEEQRKLKLEHWVTPGIVVKIVNKNVGGGAYYKHKGVVTAVEDKFCATVEVVGSGDVLRLDQDDLETVIPKVGRSVKIVNGVGRGSVAELLTISVDDFCARVRVRSGPRKCVTVCVYSVNVWLEVDGMMTDSADGARAVGAVNPEATSWIASSTKTFASWQTIRESQR